MIVKAKKGTASSAVSVMKPSLGLKNGNISDYKMKPVNNTASLGQGPNSQPQSFILGKFIFKLWEIKYLNHGL